MSQVQAGRCNNFLVISEEFDIVLVAQKSLIPRLQLGSSKITHFARQGQVSGRAKVRAGAGRRAMARARSGQMQLPGSRPSASLLASSLGACPPRPCLGRAYLVRASSLGPMAW